MRATSLPPSQAATGQPARPVIGWRLGRRAQLTHLDNTAGQPGDDRQAPSSPLTSPSAITAATSTFPAVGDQTAADPAAARYTAANCLAPPATQQAAGELRDEHALSRPGLLDPAWVLLWLLGLVAIVVFPHWAAISLTLIWITFAILYSLRLPDTGSALWLAAAVTITTSAAVGLAISRGARPVYILVELPLPATMFGLLIWHGHRRMAAEAGRADRSEQCTRLMMAERILLQDASHQLKTPITIALGHAELLARNVSDRQDKHDIQVVVAELNRLRSLSERLLLIAASQNPDFLQRESTELEMFAIETLQRWFPTAKRRWQLGQLDKVTIHADPERLALAVDAMLENACQHTRPHDVIRLSVLGGESVARLVVEDRGAGIAPTDLARIFDRFAAGRSASGHRGTGLGLALAVAIARGHGGDIHVQSVLGEGSRFELLLPTSSEHGGITVPDEAAPTAASAAPQRAADPFESRSGR